MIFARGEVSERLPPIVFDEEDDGDNVFLSKHLELGVFRGLGRHVREILGEKLGKLGGIGNILLRNVVYFRRFLLLNARYSVVREEWERFSGRRGIKRVWKEYITCVILLLEGVSTSFLPSARIMC